MSDLSRPEAYHHPAGSVRVEETHISLVFLAGDFAYKIKKGVDLGFLDYTTLSRRRHFCEEEVRLNRRLAEDVYLGVSPITRGRFGLQIEGDSEPLEYAVVMKRMSEQDMLERLVRDGAADAGLMELLADCLARFYQASGENCRAQPYASWETVAHNCRENFEQSRPLLGVAVHDDLFERLYERTESELARHRELIERRALSKRPCALHGDLRLKHVYVRPNDRREAPDGFAIVDCIEFNERFRYGDPISDIAFLGMDLAFVQQRDLARHFFDRYLAVAGDEDGRQLVPLYASYRAAVRAKVAGFKHLQETEESPVSTTLRSARAHWLLALEMIEPPGRRPCLLVVFGLPGTGKTTLSSSLSERMGADVISSDVVRKELAGLSPGTAASASFGSGIYTEEWNERTYAECLRRADDGLFRGRRLIVDANCREERWRNAFLDLADRWAVSRVFFHCQAVPEQVRRRLAGGRLGPSDADWDVHRRAAERWEPVGDRLKPSVFTLDNTPDGQEVIEAALARLRAQDLVD